MSRELFSQLPWLTDEKLHSGLYDCADCGRNTIELGHYYHVLDEVWQQAIREKPAHMLCVDCLHWRLGRYLEPDDFTDTPINLMMAIICYETGQFIISSSVLGSVDPVSVKNFVVNVIRSVLDFEREFDDNAPGMSPLVYSPTEII